MSRRPSFALILFLVVVLACVSCSIAVAMGGPSEQQTPRYDEDCTQFEEVRPGVFLQTFESTDVTRGIAGIPGRIPIEVEPGERGSICVGFHNRTGSEVKLDLRAQDLVSGKGSNDAPLMPVDNADEYGASKWLRLPAGGAVPLQHGDLAWYQVKYAVPEDATAGSYYSAIEGRIPPAKKSAKQEGVSAQVAPAVAVQLFFDIPGSAARGGKIVGAEASKVVWWDGLDLGNVDFLERFRGRESAPVRFAWRNNGDYTDEVSGKLTIKSDLTGRKVAEMNIPEQVVLRDSERFFEERWSKGIPIIGRFTPVIEMQGSDGKVDRQELDPIWVIPSWWYIAAVLLAIAVPLWLRRRSKRRYRDLLARVEAAEGRSAVETQPEWDDEAEWQEP